MQIPVRSDPDYSRYISGDPEVNLGSPTPDSSTIGWCFPPGPSNTNNDFNPPSSLNWSAYDMPAHHFNGIMDETNDNLFDSMITYEGY